MIYYIARPVSQVAKSSPSHGEGRGSTPLRVTRKETTIFDRRLSFLFCFLRSSLFIFLSSLKSNDRFRIKFKAPEITRELCHNITYRESNQKLRCFFLMEFTVPTTAQLLTARTSSQVMKLDISPVGGVTLVLFSNTMLCSASITTPEPAM